MKVLDCHEWICDWMDQLLVEDDETLVGLSQIHHTEMLTLSQILNISLYVKNNADCLQWGEKSSRRIQKHVGKANPQTVLVRELQEWPTKMLVTGMHPSLESSCNGLTACSLSQCCSPRRDSRYHHI